MGKLAQVVGDEMLVLTARESHDDHALVISQLGDLLGGLGPTDLVGVDELVVCHPGCRLGAPVLPATVPGLSPCSSCHGLWALHLRAN